MTISTVSSLYIADNIQEIIETHRFLDKRLVKMLESLVSDNEKIYTINTMTIKFGEGELSEEDLLKSFNKYRASSSSVVD